MVSANFVKEGSIEAAAKKVEGSLKVSWRIYGTGSAYSPARFLKQENGDWLGVISNSIVEYGSRKIYAKKTHKSLAEAVEWALTKYNPGTTITEVLDATGHFGHVPIGSLVG